jgi:hypothetical protein
VGANDTEVRVTGTVTETVEWFPNTEPLYVALTHTLPASVTVPEVKVTTDPAPLLLNDPREAGLACQ